MAPEINGRKALYWLARPDDWLESYKEGLGGDEKLGEEKRLLGLIGFELGLSPWEGID